jgi:hypothetical protein
MKDDLDLLLDEVDTEKSHSHDEYDDVSHSHIKAKGDDDDDDFFSDEVSPAVKQKHRAEVDDDDLDDEDADLEKLQSRVVHNLDDREEEEEEEEEVEPSKGTSKLIIGAACVVGVLSCAGVYVKFFKGESGSSAQPMVNVSMPAPSTEELGKDLSVPSTNLVDGDVEDAIDSKKQPEKLAVIKNPVPPVVHAAEPVEVAQVPVKEVTTAVVTTGAMPVVASASVGAESEPETTKTAVVPVITSNSLSQPTQSPIAQASLPSVDVASADESVSKDDVRKMVTEALHESGASDIKNQLASIQQSLLASKAATAGSTDYEKEKQKILSEIQNEEALKANAKKEANDKLVAEAINGKQRLPGFKVVNATKDGTISIITSPSGRTFALFKGENFHAANGSNLQVKEILSEGRFVVAGDNWYIDETFVELPKAVAVTKPKQVSEKTRPAAVTEASVASKKVKVDSLANWSLNATFEGGGYLVKSPSGEYKTVTKGDNDAALGTIVGIDEDGNLKTTKGLIKGGM